MLFNVPQFTDVEDKIVGSLTAKQLGWLAVAGILVLILWNSLDTSAFLLGTLIVGTIFGSLAFYRPYNQPLSRFITASFFYVLSPKVYVWRRNYDNIKTVRKKTISKKEPEIIKQKFLQKDKIREISRILDSQNR